ncbi:hdig domain protein, putative [Heliomicrobium modesticaldum Ice1]|uniref:Hdig domain protein, putative n=1 Tax=Heliobacterium modesticaldum (strain ATCC 51547 / Ice1) TaxID=498761 RepID=B0TGJ5_HELMI|nr:HDIG domain-containing metalloprotein [Heliomicrobium modesticaldum]ABZ83256.1 hdig domain protein, putative [Heliomicrobium modesticaldum Ice1]
MDSPSNLPSREAALKLLARYNSNRNLFNHMLACEAVMGALAQRFGADEAKWRLAGLLHDIDYDQTKDDPLRHSQVGADILAEAGYPDDVVYAVRVHNDVHGLPRLSRMDKALYAVDPLTGLIVAGALIKKEKDVRLIDTDFLLKRFKEKSFARGARRDQIEACSEIDLSLEVFISIGLEAMQAIAPELGIAGK